MNYLHFKGSDPSVVEFTGTMVNVSCWCPGSATNLVFNDTLFYAAEQNSTLKILDEKGIVVMSYTVDTLMGYRISTTATDLNNGTFLRCSSGTSSGSINSLRVYIYAVSGRLICGKDTVAITIESVFCAGPPSAPEPPILSALNSTTLNISWTAPWFLPLNNYTITMLNISSASIQDQWTTPKTSYLVTKPQNSDCELFDFTVEANTGVGSTGPSQPSTAGFPSRKIE